ncbi:Protein of unknown function D [Prunus dulcis]|uniref:Uncharacterized protein n=1 Tax=Prunus dulcis TaxID=3755 RepID=A0A4Y1R7G3_PRUDU|nr:Protein of unknown function D [Prunus dulcis]
MSRFSVAWYPIYRIPELNFRASFLTYHSLGHFAQRPFPTDASNEHTSRIHSPVLGLQSYNALGEGWFDPKIPTASNSAEILKERLRTLEANAIRFGRGCVFKDKVMFHIKCPSATGGLISMAHFLYQALTKSQETCEIHGCKRRVGCLSISLLSLCPLFMDRRASAET